MINLEVVDLYNNNGNCTSCQYVNNWINPKIYYDKVKECGRILSQMLQTTCPQLNYILKDGRVVYSAQERL